MIWDTNRLSKWAKNTLWHHKMRGLQLDVSKKEILREANKIIEQNDGRCPVCGCKMNQQHQDAHQMTLDYITRGEFQIVCSTCNQLLGNPRERVVECCSK